jgi:hypothetical protein
MDVSLYLTVIATATVIATIVIATATIIAMVGWRYCYRHHYCYCYHHRFLATQASPSRGSILKLCTTLVPPPCHLHLHRRLGFSLCFQRKSCTNDSLSLLAKIRIKQPCWVFLSAHVDVIAPPYASVISIAASL